MRVIQKLKPYQFGPIDPTTETWLFDDFTSSQTGFGLGWTPRTSGTGASVSTANSGATAHRTGIANLICGTTTTGRSGIALYDASELQFTSGVVSYLEWMSFQSTLSDGTETYVQQIGFIDSENASGDGTDGLFFRYTHSVNSGNWVCHAKNGGAETTANTSVAVVLNTVYRLGILVHGASSAVFLINGVPVATITTNLPEGATNRTHIGAKIEKSAGTTTRSFLLDYMLFHRKISRW